MAKNRVKYLHIFTYTLFIDSYIDFINKNFDSKDHLFLILTDVGNVNDKKNVKKISKNFSSLLILIKEMYKCKKIFLHGLIHYQLLLILFFQPWLLKKCNWVVLGIDLYLYKLRKKSLISDLYEIVRRFIIKNLYGIVAFIKEDYELAKKWYKTKAKHYYSFLYPNPIYREINLPKINNKNNKYIYIQVGNAADPALNHLEVFQKLEKYKNKNIKIVCPLAYGYNNYRNKIIQKGVETFGNKFYSITKLLSFGEYSELLATVDIAIFNFQGQQAGYNILTLIGLGKKVYINNNTTFWKLCSNFGLKVYNYNNLNGLLQKIPNEIKFKNIDIIKNYFTEKKLKDDWHKIFQDK
jgi:hypothetical protein